MNQWNQEHKKEEYYKKAKQQDYRSRASFKLLQLNRKYKIIKNGDSVVDLGAAPGGWSQVALELVGEDGLVVAVDLNWIKPFPEENFWGIKGDFTAEETLEEIRRTLQGKAQVVISDAAPKLSGIKDLDQLRSIDLAQTVLLICDDVLKYKGNMVMKVFQGEGYPELLKEVKRKFQTVRTTKPPSSRKKSGEMYVVARGFQRAGKQD
ncbi:MULTISPECIES: RlmE family RNA methyltransferase [Methanobacterium]|jgi:23S rRNA (uridine2552-2'-O)-methyltransferase|uniref:Ribosomal RNA large subunit methyltransferase E n=1 Tax=Methanobacterium formicicum TaxID=2162 RepID=A0A090I233_METFO|nr:MULTISPECIES: SAM-dependent methyltransferase [Methanobacterium]AIS31540.1 ribosomal RNA large subunit methyltransferase J RrmJ [Methanobacterium formicicum]KUK74946.1 MAG: Ribosomal RNA large subunit methyltransferase E [Methanobacterium sp. 42_16]MBF4475428.1 23S rRNA (uridine(2552)-2'-O)-methyltransferase [Methanobacterium formicicum]MDG3547629.1 SAM-dependent methyltransferase [Methanobacterium formicicum]MDH2658885.1 SAM-dependent methyltransferase [Methanobacterium formicicum]